MNQELYQQVILEHNKKPKNYGPLEGATHTAEGFNPLCGDHIWVDLKLENQTIQDIKFRGEGCAICKASASLMTGALKLQDTDHARLLFQEFQRLVKGDLKPDLEANSLGKLAVFSGVWQFPSRVKCAALAWHTVMGALEKKQSVSTE